MTRWFKRHITDPFVKKSLFLKVRARSYFKLEEIDSKFDILNKESRVVLFSVKP